MEIKRELLIGELSSVKKSMLPIIGAIGGMVVPAGIYYLWCGNTPYSGGWGVPMATDIAFSLGVLSLLGKRAPFSVKIFLTALAIIDDLGAILAIALFYTSSLELINLALGGVVFLAQIMLNLFKVHRSYIYFILGAALWYFIFNSGIHATIAGVLLAFTIPLKHINQIENRLHDPVNFIILPLFALANTAIILPSDFLSIFSSRVHHGIFMGLLLGKPLGIFLLCFLAVKLRIASLPKNMSWKQVLGLGLIAGIGFTMSIFIATLAFDEAEVQLISKVAIIGASLAAGVAGFIYLRMLKQEDHVVAEESYEVHDDHEKGQSL
jgi:NhaA family Na+:H+ antiporter